MAQLAIAGLQLDLAQSDNFARIDKELRAMKARLPWVELAVLSELAVHGPSVTLAEEAGGLTERRFSALARELGIWLVPGSFFQRRGEAVFNTTPVIDPRGQIVARYDKMFPFLPYEEGVEAGGDYVLFDIPGAGRVGLSNCYDMWFPETVRTLAAMGAEIIIHPSLTNTIDRDVELSIARANAAISQVYFFDLNGAGAQGLGRSGLYGPGGEIIYRAGQGRDVMAFRIDLAEVRRVRGQGWHGLGQMLKSFRDSKVPFPCHSIEGRRTASLEALGPLRKAGANGEAEAAMASAVGGKSRARDIGKG